jgi:hypothetical protein
MIIDKNDLEVWMISLIGNHHADALRTVTVPKWEKEGLKVNLFDAITPNTMYDLPYQLKFGMKENLNRNPVEFTETEKAVWYSHFCLWEKCVIEDKPFLILEEDTRPIKKVPQNFSVDSLLQLARLGAAYIIRPIDCRKKWLETALKRTLTYNVDNIISSFNG